MISSDLVWPQLVEYVGRVVFAGGDGSLRVYVEAHHKSLRTGQQEPTCEFHFVFHTGMPKGGDASTSAALLPAAGRPGDLDAKDEVPHVQVQPTTYEEGLMFLEGRRRWMNSTGQYGADTTNANDGFKEA